MLAFGTSASRVFAVSENITQLNFTTAPQTIDANATSTVITIQTQNATSSLEKVSGTTTLNLTSTSATGEFSSNSTNWIAVATLTMSTNSANRSFYYRDTTAGTHTLTVTASVGGVAREWTPATQAIVITGTRVAPTISVASSSVLYTGSAQSAIVSGSVPGVVSNIAYNASTTTPIDAGTYAVTADFAPDDSANYDALTSAPAGDFVIGRAALTVTPDNHTKTEGEIFSAFTGVIDGIKGSDALAARYASGGASADAPVGSYEITATLDDPDSRLGNYDLVYRVGTLEVSAPAAPAPEALPPAAPPAEPAVSSPPPPASRGGGRRRSPVVVVPVTPAVAASPAQGQVLGASVGPLTRAQAGSLVEFLRSFGVDQSIIDRVREVTHI